MNALQRPLNWTAQFFNDLPFWKGECRVWGLRLQSLNFERWLYLRAHRLGIMGKADKVFFEKNIRPGMRVMDVGANLGLYSAFIARRVGAQGRVISFEPDPDLLGLLRRNCALNALTQVESHALALGSTRATLMLHKMIINSGDNHYGALKNDLFRRSIETRVVPLDEYLPGLEVDLIKIDVQGWELEVLRGMRRTLATNPGIKIYFEFMPAAYERAGSTAVEIIDFLRQLDFRIFDAGTGAELAAAAMSALVQKLGPQGYVNLLAARS